jgi:hypothetical protein
VSRNREQEDLMLARLTIAAALLSAAPALATTSETAPEVRIRHIGSLLETVPDPRRGVFIRAYNGRWYYARTEGDCPRLNFNARLRLVGSPGNRFDRDSAIVVDGWRCLVASVTESAGPPPRH